ncbi:TniQ family protein [Bacillus cereus]|uniref:TniQ family protein n=1 Tax=Bacillus cereus TaxID=1396 RepID=UPI003672FC2E
MKRLLFTPRPLLDESLSGYIVRLAQENFLDSAKWIYDLIEQDSKKYQIQTIENLGRLNKLGELIGMVPQNLHRLSFYEELVIAGEEKWLNKLIFRQTFDREGLKFCPLCVKEKGHYHKLWELSMYLTCPLHMCFLVTQCCECQKKISWNNQHLYICSCGYNLLHSPLNKADEILTTTSAIIMNAYYCKEIFSVRKTMLSQIPLNTIIFILSLLESSFMSKKSNLRLFVPHMKDKVSTFKIINMVFSYWPSKPKVYGESYTTEEEYVVEILSRLLGYNAPLDSNIKEDAEKHKFIIKGKKRNVHMCTLTEVDVSSIIGICVECLRYMVERRFIFAEKKGENLLFSLRDVGDFLEHHVSFKELINYNNISIEEIMEGLDGHVSRNVIREDCNCAYYRGRWVIKYFYKLNERIPFIDPSREI